ncbi:MAG TPA: hypothetical protein VM618_11420, partial [Acidimicrobiia bacterium]|nr:hypothetical protein [Acidimicrobiia bacterium]
LAGCAAGESAAREFGYAGAPLSGDAALDRASELAGGLARALMDPLRSRMADALGEAAAIEDPDVAERVRARYREWKTKRIEEIVADALAAAFARGLFDVLPADVPLRWITGTTDACPDCADNALEQTPRGGEFPTGHVAPPAHPGCRCLVVPAEFPAAAATG